MSHKYIALETQQYCSRLVSISQRFCQAVKLRLCEGVPKAALDYEQCYPLTPMDNARAFDWLLATVEQLVNARMIHTTTPSDIGQVHALFGDLGLTLDRWNKYWAKNFMVLDEVDSLIIDLHQLIDQHIEFNTWIQWTVHTTHRSIALVSDQDYRIAQWEEITGYRDGGKAHHLLELDLSNVVSYLRKRINADRGPIEVELNGATRTVLPGNIINFVPILEDTLAAIYPRISFPDELHLGSTFTDLTNGSKIDFSRLGFVGVNNYEAFRSQYVRPVLENFGLVHIARRLDDTDLYIASIDQNHVLTIDYADASQWRKPQNEETELQQLAESLAAGDYLPPADRRRAEAYLAEHGYNACYN